LLRDLSEISVQRRLSYIEIIAQISTHLVVFDRRTIGRVKPRADNREPMPTPTLHFVVPIDALHSTDKGFTFTKTRDGGPDSDVCTGVTFADWVERPTTSV
jgi:hypothetical protein